MRSGFMDLSPDQMPRSVLSWDSRKKSMQSTIKTTSKVMAVAFTGYVDDHVENGGNGLKLGFLSVQLECVTAKRVSW